MNTFKKTFKEMNNFVFNVLITMTFLWGMYLSVVLTFKISNIGIPILLTSIFVAIIMRKSESETEK